MTALIGFVRELGKELDRLVPEWDAEVAKGIAPNPFRMLVGAVGAAAKRTLFA